jgi:hypothetical protein
VPAAVLAPIARTSNVNMDIAMVVCGLVDHPAATKTQLGYVQQFQQKAKAPFTYPLLVL